MPDRESHVQPLRFRPTCAQWTSQCHARGLHPSARCKNQHVKRAKNKFDSVRGRLLRHGGRQSTTTVVDCLLSCPRRQRTSIVFIDTLLLGFRIADKPGASFLHSRCRESITAASSSDR